MQLDLNNIDSKIHSYGWLDAKTADEIIQERKLRNLRMNNELFNVDPRKDDKEALRIQMEVKRELPDRLFDKDANDQLNEYVKHPAVLQRNWLLDGGVNQDATYNKPVDKNSVEAVKEANANFAAKRDRFIVRAAPDAPTTTNDLLRKLVEEKKANMTRQRNLARR